MRNRLNVLAFGCLAFAVAACGGSSQAAMKDGADPWADFKGTYSASQAKGQVSPEAKSEAKTEPKQAAKQTAEQNKDATDDADANAKDQSDEAPSAKKASTAMIKGKSISSIDDAALAEAAKGVLKKKVVSTTIITGAKHEQVKVRLEGAVVLIIRPVPAEEAGKGAVDAPKDRRAALNPAEAAYFDEDADVLVTVDAGSKNASQKALAGIVSARKR